MNLKPFTMFLTLSCLCVTSASGVGAKGFDYQTVERLGAQDAKAGVATETIQIGTSVKGAPITASRYGTKGGAAVLLVGQLHGSEKGSRKILQGIADSMLLDAPTLDVWIIFVANPDGTASNDRTNFNKVDLNRNFPTSDWKLSARGRNYSGKYARSEPETKALVDFIQTRKPVLSVWYHQVGPVVDPHPLGDMNIMREYAKTVKYPLSAARCAGSCVGTATTYHSENVKGSTAFVVELPATVTRAHVDRNVSAFRHILTIID